MKPNIILIILMLVLSLNIFSQNKFSKRKYTKGNFAEKLHHLKHHKLIDKQPLSNDILNRKEIPEEEVKSQLLEIYNNPVASLKPIQSKDTLVKLETMTQKQNDYYKNIVKHNTIFTNRNKEYASSDKRIIVSQQSISQQHKPSLKKSPDDIPGLNWNFEGIGDALLGIIVWGAIILVIAAFSETAALIILGLVVLVFIIALLIN